MPLVPAKCPSCGGDMQIDNGREHAFCPYCGTKFLVESAVNYYNTTNNYSAEVINVFSGDNSLNSLESMVDKVCTLRRIGRDKDAFELCMEIETTYPGECAGYSLAVEIILDALGRKTELTNLQQTKSISEALAFINSQIDIVDNIDTQKAGELREKIAEGERLALHYTEEYEFVEDTQFCWLIWMINSRSNPSVIEGIAKGKEVDRLLMEAPCYYYHSLCNLYKEEPYEYNRDDGKVLLSVLFAQGNRIVILITGRQYSFSLIDSFCYYRMLLLVNSVEDDIQRVVDEVLTREFATPAGLFTWAGSEERREQAKSHKVQKWKSQNRCRYCGGKFYERPKPGIRGLLGESIKICKDCGKEKDY